MSDGWPLLLQNAFHQRKEIATQTAIQSNRYRSCLIPSRFLNDAIKEIQPNKAKEEIL
jgi:hypothetical protein